MVVDEVVGRFHVAKKAEEYRVLEENFGVEEYGVGLRKEDTELLTKLEASMAEMKKDGKAAEIATKWFGKDIIK
ncbi:Cystine-binding periplasmic protein precursor [compost metagenome]